MEVLEAITTRRSIRNYTGVPISEEQLDAVLRAGFQAPSAHNKQPWHFIVVRDQNSLTSLAKFHPYAKMLPSAGCGIVACGDKKLEGETGFIVEDCSAAIQNMLLAAHGIGLGAVWCGLYPVSNLTRGVKQILYIPDDIIPVGFVVVGNKESDRPAIDRYDAVKVHSEKWQEFIWNYCIVPCEANDDQERIQMMNIGKQSKGDRFKISDHFLSGINTNRVKIKQPPGTLHYTGIYSVEHPRIESIRYNTDEITHKEIQDVEDIQDSETHIQWINITGLSDTSLIESLGSKFDIHRIHLEDIVDVSQRSKLEINGSYLFSILKMFYLENMNIISEHVSVVIKGNTLITFQEKPGDIFDTVRERLDSSQGIIRSMGVGYLFFCLVDRFVDEYFISLQYAENRFADIEAAVIEQKNTSMDAIYKIRKDLLYLKNCVGPLKEILETIIGADTPFFSEEIKRYFTDVLDNTAKIYEAITTYREMVNGLYEAQAANRNDDMNRKIMTLTVITVIFIPLSFLTGIFGMNFLHMPLLENPYSFVMFIVTCVLIVSAMLIFFKRKKWF